MGTVSYLRVSRIDQNTEKFKHDVNAYAEYKKLGVVDHIEEKVSGRKVDWKERAIWGILQDKNVKHIITPELSRLARSTKQILEIVEVVKQSGKTIHLMKEGLIIGNKTNAVTNMFITILSSLAQMEAELISERTKEALAERKRRGVKLGRRKGQVVGKKLDGKLDEIRGYMAIDKNKTWIAEKMGVTRATLYNFLKGQN